MVSGNCRRGRPHADVYGDLNVDVDIDGDVDLAAYVLTLHAPNAVHGTNVNTAAATSRSPSPSMSTSTSTFKSKSRSTGRLAWTATAT